MASHDRPRSDELRDLIERIERSRAEIDRVSRESEQVRNRADHAMKQRFWPERRHSVRIPDDDSKDHRGERG